MFRWLVNALQVVGLAALSAQAFASGIPSATLFLSWIPILVYVICAIIWVIKFRKWSIAKRLLLIIFVFPFFAMSAVMIPLVMADQNKYIDVIEVSSAVILTIIVMSIFLGSLAIVNTRK